MTGNGTESARTVSRPRWTVSYGALAVIAALAAGANAVLAELNSHRWAAHIAAAAVLMLVLATWLLTSRPQVRATVSIPRWYAPAVLAVALIAAASWASAQDAAAGLSAGSAVLIAGTGAIAVGSAVPLLIARRAGDQLGVHISDARALTASERIDAVVLDGLRTVTNGKHVKDIAPHDEKYLRDLRWFAGALAHASDDPTDQAIAKLSPMRGHLSGVERVPGEGIAGTVDQHPVRVGRPSWIGFPDAPNGSCAIASGNGAAEPETETVGVEVDLRPMGTITVADTVPDEVPAAVSKLASTGIDTVLVTSTAAPRATAIAAQAGVAKVLGPDELTPAGIRGDTGKQLAIVTARSFPDVPTAALAIQATDNGTGVPTVRVVRADLPHAAAALNLLRRTRRSLRRNLIAALTLHGITIAAAAVGLLSPLLSALAALAAAVALAAASLAQSGDHDRAATGREFAATT